MRQTVIALMGPIGSGKTTIANMLRDEHGFVAIKFASFLKDMLRTLYASAGLNQTETERRIEGDLKESPCAILRGKTPRWAMQSLGTEWGRDLIATDLWLHLGVERARRSGPARIVFEDCRFLNEAETLRRELQAEIWDIRGRGRACEHISEKERYEIYPTIIIHNTGTIEDLRYKVRYAMTLLREDPATVYEIGP
jgi:GTPase SAR1 family protein